MARSSSGGNGTTPKEKHEVFISFRGIDTRKTFTSHLQAALTRLGVRTYVDYSLERGDEISAALLKAIEDAKLSLVIFSQKYATSRWCLDELVKMVECRKSKGHMIVPIFYGTDPSSIRKQTDSYAEAFAKHEEKGINMAKLQAWRAALIEAANLAGWAWDNNNRTEHEIVEDIARSVLEKLDGVYVRDLDIQIEKLEQLAQLQEEISEQIPSLENKKNYEATLRRIKRHNIEKKWRKLRLTPELLSHMEVSSVTNNYF